MSTNGAEPHEQIVRFHCRTGLQSHQRAFFKRTVDRLSNSFDASLWRLDVEHCFYVCLAQDRQALDDDEHALLRYFLTSSLTTTDADTAGNDFSVETQLTECEDDSFVIEIGPRLAFQTPFSTNAVASCRAAGLNGLQRLEKSTRYAITPPKGLFDLAALSSLRSQLTATLHDRMTECVYATPPRTFQLETLPEKCYQIDTSGGSVHDATAVLQEANRRLGLALDDWDISYYLDLFRNKAQRNPTDVELFDLAQSNSEHSRHWFFKGRLFVDGIERPKCLFDIIQDTQNDSNPNNVIKFSDNSSAIRGYPLNNLLSVTPGTLSQLKPRNGVRHVLYTAETHNFPTGVCPFPGATTGTGGRIRDVQATGRGAHEIAGIAGYSVGNLHLPGYRLPWEEETDKYPGNFAPPDQILIDASNGASDYGNKFGEPVVAGFTRSFGMRIPSSNSDIGERWEWIKPIMFSGGIGAIDDDQLQKHPPQKGMLVVKLGGPVYRIGVGGGSASSVHVQGDAQRQDELDFGAVQRGDPQMEHKLHRAIRACVELGADANPILSIHDQGAGGNGNVLKELVEGAGAVISMSSFQLADPTLSSREIWIAEYQENNAVLIHPDRRGVVETICKRERCPLSVVGEVTDDNIIVVKDEDRRRNDGLTPVNLNLEWALGKIPPKAFYLSTKAPQPNTSPLSLDISVVEALELVLRLPAVASKRYLTNKVDRSVTGLVAQQQCVGMLHTPMADVAVVALSYFEKKGAAVAVGEQPIKGLLNAECGARMSVGEALTNLVFAPVTELRDVKCSGNWMWAAKLPGEGARLLAACDAMCALMRRLGIAVDGGKDSLSMAANVDGEVVKAPGTLVVSAYVPCPDITQVVTPDLKCPDGKGQLVYVRFANNDLKSLNRLGGTALAQCQKRIGDTPADLDDTDVFVKAFECTQLLLKNGCISAGHDVSDGGLIGCLLEMTFAGNCSIALNIIQPSDAITFLFAEELGIVVETTVANLPTVIDKYAEMGVIAIKIGESLAEYGPHATVNVRYNDEQILTDSTVRLRSVWEETSFELEKLQTSPNCAIEEQQFLRRCTGLDWKVSFDYGGTTSPLIQNGSVGNGHSMHLEGRQQLCSPPNVAILREEGSNGDREMAAAFYMAGFQVWDICMQDVLNEDNKMNLDEFKGVAFVGGFSYADVLGSAKGWAGSIIFHKHVKKMFERFYRREDTFSLGVCNGCQLMALLGWVGNRDMSSTSQQVVLEWNDCGRFQSYFNSVHIDDSPSIMLRGMQGTTMGVWVSHGEGKFVYRTAETLDRLSEQKLVALRYVEGGKGATTFPSNPNGSERGVAGLVSADGRHLALMPHPERCFLTWQWPYWPTAVENGKFPEKAENLQSPWMKMFNNAFDWCNHPSSR